MFTIDDEELGELLEVTVGHDNTGYSASWHMDHMAVTNTKTGQRFLFQCRWGEGGLMGQPFLAVLLGDVCAS